ncbi:hypothetical protein WI92_14600 [Burkholderia vietnamiensis]|uniref:hypothetical protein n=1 Tax=Burkholderia vietnamiensis TaxID=60552 RepID=UPI000753E23B|nr:hypothetical protein [Burkholderia vietnamiensis]KVE13317.1 hypothetical protein WI92_14600 [Burkholderia vietnamiensis]
MATVNPVLLNLSQVLPSDLPFWYPDGIMNPGSKLLFDFSNPACNANAAGLMSAGQTFTNLVSGAPVGTVNAATNTAYNPTNVGGNGGISFPGQNTNIGNVSLGSTYDMHATNDDWLVILWLKLAATPINANAYANIWGLQSNAQNGLFAFDTGSDNKSPRVVANPQSNSPTPQPLGASFTLGSVQQVAVSWQKTGASSSVAKVFINGVFAFSFGAGGVTLLDMSAYSMNLGSAKMQGSIYMAYMEDLTVSGADPAAQVVADYALRTGAYA